MLEAVSSSSKIWGELSVETWSYQYLVLVVGSSVLTMSGIVPSSSVSSRLPDCEKTEKCHEDAECDVDYEICWHRV